MLRIDYYVTLLSVLSGCQNLMDSVLMKIPVATLRIISICILASFAELVS